MNSKTENPIVNMKCRRGSDRMTVGQTCDGMMAEKLSKDGSRSVSFCCTKCRFTWTVAIGGSFSLE